MNVSEAVPFGDQSINSSSLKEKNTGRISFRRKLQNVVIELIKEPSSILKYRKALCYMYILSMGVVATTIAVTGMYFFLSYLIH